MPVSMFEALTFCIQQCKKITILSVYTLQKKMQVLTPMFSKNIDLKQKKQITGMKKLTNS